MKTEKLFENQRKHQRQIMFDTDYEYDNPFGWNGNIDSIVYRRYCADRYYCDGIHWEEIDRSEIKFNEFGKVQNLTRHHLGKLINKTRNKYDKAGRLIVQESIDEPGRLFVAYNYKYDSSGKLIEKIIKNKKNLLFKHLYTYDEHGRLIQKFSHCLVGGDKFWTTYLYNEEGNIAMQTLYVHDYITARNESALVPIEIDEVTYFDDNGYAEVRKDGKYGLINADGEFVIPCIYDELRRLKNIQYAVVRINEKWGAVDLQNNTLIEFLYEDAFDDKDNYVVVVQDGKMGCIGVLDKMGVNIPCKYDMIGHFNENGYTATSLNCKWGVIDVNDNPDFVTKILVET